MHHQKHLWHSLLQTVGRSEPFTARKDQTVQVPPFQLPIYGKLAHCYFQDGV